MTKDVLISIKGLQIDNQKERDEDEAIEVITPANYFYKNGKHYVIYDEVTEGVMGSTKNKIKITGTDMLEIIKSGVTNAHMVFEKNKKNLTCYNTPYGQMMMGLHTSNMEVDVTENNIRILIEYVLDVNHGQVADYQIQMDIKSKTAGNFVLMS